MQPTFRNHKEAVYKVMKAAFLNLNKISKTTFKSKSNILIVFHHDILLYLHYMCWTCFVISCEFSLHRLLLCKWWGTLPFCPYCCSFHLRPPEADKAARSPHWSVSTGCSEGTVHLQVRVAEDHELGTGVHVIPFDEGEVHSSDSLQAWEVWIRLPVLSVLLHHLLPEMSLLAAQRTDSWV